MSDAPFSDCLIGDQRGKSLQYFTIKKLNKLLKKIRGKPDKMNRTCVAEVSCFSYLVNHFSPSQIYLEVPWWFPIPRLGTTSVQLMISKVSTGCCGKKNLLVMRHCLM